MLTVDKFFCCSLRSGAILILSWNVIYSFNGLMFLIVNFVSGNGYCFFILLIVLAGFIISLRALFHTPDKNETYSTLLTSIKWLRYSWYYNALMVFVLMILYFLFICCQLTLNSQRAAGFHFGFGVLFSLLAGIQTYFTLVLYSYYTLIVESAQNNGLNTAIPLSVRSNDSVTVNHNSNGFPQTPSAPTLPGYYSNNFVQMPTAPTLPRDLESNNCINYLR